jgi:dienelactone hydrolase
LVVSDVPPPNPDAGLVAFSDWSTTYNSDGRTLPGFFVAPPGRGPFPGIVFHHGSAGLMAAARPSIEQLVAMGYAVFAPVRRGHNGSPGPFWESLVTAAWGSTDMGVQLVDALDAECDDALAGLAWLRDHPHVDPERTAMIGSSFGGVMVMLAAASDAPFRAGISFAGPSFSWPDAPALQTRLLSAVGSAQVPLTLIQAGDDLHLTPDLRPRSRTVQVRQATRDSDLRTDRPPARRRPRGVQQGPRALKGDVARFLARTLAPDQPPTTIDQ